MLNHRLTGCYVTILLLVTALLGCDSPVSAPAPDRVLLNLSALPSEQLADPRFTECADLVLSRRGNRLLAEIRNRDGCEGRGWLGLVDAQLNKPGRPFDPWRITLQMHNPSGVLDLGVGVALVMDLERAMGSWPGRSETQGSVLSAANPTALTPANHPRPGQPAWVLVAELDVETGAPARVLESGETSGTFTVEITVPSSTESVVLPLLIQAGGWLHRGFGPGSAPAVPAFLHHKDGTQILVHGNEVPEAATLRLPAGAALTFWFDTDGRPTHAFSDDHFFVFGNWTDEAVDVGVLTPTGGIAIARAVPLPTQLRGEFGSDNSMAALRLVPDFTDPFWGFFVDDFMVNLTKAMPCLIGGTKVLLGHAVEFPTALLACASGTLDIWGVGGEWAEASLLTSVAIDCLTAWDQGPLVDPGALAACYAGVSAPAFNWFLAVQGSTLARSTDMETASSVLSGTGDLCPTSYLPRIGGLPLAYTLGSTVAGELNDTSCPSFSGRFDSYTYDNPSGSAVRFELSGSPELTMSFRAPSLRAGGNGSFSVVVLQPSGPQGVEVETCGPGCETATWPVNYTLRSVTNPLLQDCELIRPANGSSATLDLPSAVCQLGPGQMFSLVLAESIDVEVTSTDFLPLIEVHEGFTSPVIRSSTGQAGPTVRLRLSESDGHVVLRVSSTEPGQSGSYTITFSGPQ